MPPKEDPFRVTPTPSLAIKDFYEFSAAEKRKVCCHLPLSWKLFLDETPKKKRKVAKLVET